MSYRFREGDKVFHKTYKNGIVTKDEIVDSQVITVLFEGHKSEKLIVNTFLTLIEINKSHESREELSSDLNKNIEIAKLKDGLAIENIKIIPNGYLTSDFFETEEKEILTKLSKTLIDGYASIGTNPIGSYPDNSKIGYIINPQKGVIVFKIFTNDNVSAFCKSYKTIISFFQNSFSLKVRKWLLETKSITQTNGDMRELAFPLKTIAVFQNINYKDVIKELHDTNIDFQNIYFRSFTNNYHTNPLELLNSLEKGYPKLDDSQVNIIASKLIPEYSVIIFEGNSDEAEESYNPVDLDELKTILSRKYKAIMLDEEQIRLINGTKPGHYLTLANPGTGKSVILISKAYRLACLYREEILVTCYNRNLNERYSLLKEQSGFHDKSNLRIYTFNRLVYKVLEDNGYTEFRHSVDDNNDDYDKAVDALFDKLSRGLIKKTYRAILIDEVQLFNPKWIDICYMLLKKPHNESYFEMYGDLNQDVKNRKSKGIASWQSSELLPSLKGRVRYFTKNYRNTIQISYYLNHMMILFNDRLNKLKCKINQDDIILKSNASNKGMKPTILNREKNEIDKYVTKIIKALHVSKNVDYSDIVVIFPSRQNKALRYYPLNNIKRTLESNDIPFSEIFGENKCKLIDSNGITLTTIDSSLGLDFRVVILAGLYSLNYYFTEESKPITMPSFITIQKQYPDEVVYHYIRTVRLLYAAASRAREALFIVNDLGETSVFNELINLRGGEQLYERK